MGRTRRDIHVILDLDETLILTDTTRASARGPGGSPRRRAPENYVINPGVGDEPDYFDIPYGRVFLRPYAKQFLLGVFENAKTVSIWSAGVPGYVRAIAARLEALAEGRKFYFVWTRNECKHLADKTGAAIRGPDGSPVHIKPLRVVFTSDEGRAVGMNCENTILIDDLELNHRFNADGVYAIPSYSRPSRHRDIALPECLALLVEHIYSDPRKADPASDIQDEYELIDQ